MNNKNKKTIKEITSKYWKVAEIVGFLFIIYNYAMWTQPFKFIKAIVIFVGVTVVTFFAINILDLCLGLTKALFSYIKRKRHEKRLLKGFINQEGNY